MKRADLEAFALRKGAALRVGGSHFNSGMERMESAPEAQQPPEPQPISQIAALVEEVRQLREALAELARTVAEGHVDSATAMARAILAARPVPKKKIAWHVIPQRDHNDVVTRYVIEPSE